jgi:hypothetical protein
MRVSLRPCSSAAVLGLIKRLESVEEGLSKDRNINSVMSCSKPVQTISFAEIIRGRDATVRVTHDHLIYAVDLVMVMNGADRRYASQVIPC